MPWPSGGPRTWNPAETVTATMMNEQLRDPLNVLKSFMSDDGEPSWIKHGELASDFSKQSDVTLANVSGLSFSVAASEIWIWLCLLKLISPAAADAKFTFTGPTSPTSVLFGVLGSSGAPIGAGAEATFGNAIVISTANLEESVLLWGSLNNGANAGTVQAQFAQNASNATPSVIRARSRLVAVRLFT